MTKVFVVLDRSLSMRDRNLWGEALTSIDEYVLALPGDYDVEVTSFDSESTPTGNGMLVRSSSWNSQYTTKTLLETVYDGTVSNWKSLKNRKNFYPRGGTPLFEAVIETIRKARKVNSEKTVILIMTDGDENSSGEAYPRVLAEEMIISSEQRGWEVIFLGAGFKEVYKATGTFRAADAVLSKTLYSDVGDVGKTMRGFAKSTMAYTSGTAMNFAEQNKDKM